MIKRYLLVAAKHAVNAALLSLGPVYHSPQAYNLHTWHGLIGVAQLVGAAVLVRESMVWVPKLMKWSTTDVEVVEDGKAVGKGVGA